MFAEELVVVVVVDGADGGWPCKEVATEIGTFWFSLGNKAVRTGPSCFGCIVLTCLPHHDLEQSFLHAQSVEGLCPLMLVC